MRQNEVADRRQLQQHHDENGDKAREQVHLAGNGETERGHHPDRGCCGDAMNGATALEDDAGADEADPLDDAGGDAVVAEFEGYGAEERRGATHEGIGSNAGFVTPELSLEPNQRPEAEPEENPQEDRQLFFSAHVG